MLEFSQVRSDVLGCFGKPAALDLFAKGASLPIRVAPDELLRIGECNRLPELEAELITRDPAAIVIDLSSSYKAWTLRGEDRREAFCRLSQVALPTAPATIQGLVAQVPAKVIVKTDELIILLPSVVSHHLKKRVLASCADLGVGRQFAEVAVA